MEHILDTFLKTITLETNKFNLDKDEIIFSIKELSSTFIEDFDVPYERCAYMYRYSTIHFYFLKRIIYDFLSGYEDPITLIEGWRPKSNFCSLGFGPGLDFLAFTCALLELEAKPSLPVFQNVNILRNHGAWRNTVNLLSDAIWRAKESNKINKSIKFRGLNVLQTNIFSNFKENAIEILKNSDVVFMFKLLNLIAPDDRGDIKDTLNKLASNIKPGATIFFADTTLSCNMMTKVLSAFYGTYLYGPLRVNHVFPDDFPEELISVWGKTPIKSARGMFFVWKKCIPESELNKKPKFNSLDYLSSTQMITSINVNSKKELNSNISSGNQQQINPSILENKGQGSSFNDKSLESKIANKTSGSNMSEKNTIDCLEHGVLKSTVSSFECKEILSDISKEKDAKSSDGNNLISKSSKESKYTQTDPPFTEALSENQLSIIKSLTVKINDLANSVENNFELQNQMKRKEDLVTSMVSEKLNTIEHLTERINTLINSLELVQNNQLLDAKCEEILCDDLD